MTDGPTIIGKHKAEPGMLLPAPTPAERAEYHAEFEAQRLRGFGPVTYRCAWCTWVGTSQADQDMHIRDDHGITERPRQLGRRGPKPKPPTQPKPPANPCACGCGKDAVRGRRYAYGHATAATDCAKCGTTFKPKSSTGRFCSQRCAVADRVRRQREAAVEDVTTRDAVPAA